MNVQEEIRKLAYDFYEKSGRMGGMELEHWLRAEQIVMSKLAAHGKVEATKPETEKPLKSAAVAATEITRPKPARPAARGRVRTAEPKPETPRKSASTEGGSTKPKRAQKKKPGTRAGEKTGKAKG